MREKVLMLRAKVITHGRCSRFIILTEWRGERRPCLAQIMINSGSHKALEAEPRLQEPEGRAWCSQEVAGAPASSPHIKSLLCLLPICPHANQGSHELQLLLF